MIIDILTAAGTQKLWKGERIVFHGQNAYEFTQPVKMWTNLHGSYDSPIATYTPTSNNELYVDLTDYVRAYPSVTNVYFDGAHFEDRVSISVSVAGLINPASVIIPQHKLDTGGGFCHVEPPSLMYWDGSHGVQAEFYSVLSGWILQGDASFSDSKRQINSIVGAFSLSLYGAANSYDLSQLACGVNYAYVRWISFSGVQRTHVFEVVKNKSESADNYSLLPVDNEYVEIKGRRDGFTLRLDGLNAYDYWYYADVLLSSKVEVSLDSNLTSWAQVQVTTKNVTIPDGEAGEKGKLEINVNWKRYDAVSM